jgi:hypothetical protein
MASAALRSLDACRDRPRRAAIRQRRHDREEFCQAGYTSMPTPIEGPMTWRLRKIPSDEEVSHDCGLLPG